MKKSMNHKILIIIAIFVSFLFLPLTAKAATSTTCSYDNGAHTLTHYARIQETCTSSGREEYWYCSKCYKRFWDAACTDEMESLYYIPKTDHYPVYHGAKAATCKEKGNVAYWQCKRCNNYFLDENCTQKKTFAQLQTTGKHAPVYVPVKKSAALDNGNIYRSTLDGSKDYYRCKTCQKTFSNSACTVAISAAAIEIPGIQCVTVTSSSCYYDGKAHVPSVKVLDRKGKVIPSSNYTVSCDQGYVSAGPKDIKVTFVSNSNYSGTVYAARTYEIRPRSKYTLTLGKKLTLSTLAGNAVGSFSLADIYTNPKGFYRFAVADGSKTIKTDGKKVNFDKMSSKVTVKMYIGGKPYETAVTLALPDPVMKVKTGSSNRIQFTYRYPKKSSIQIRVKNFPAPNKTFDKYTKTHKVSDKNCYFIIKKATAKKLGNKATITMTIKCKGWKTKKYTKTVKVK